MPGLEGWLERVFMVMGGFIAGAGVLTILVWVRSATRRRWAGLALALAGFLTVGMMSVINFQIGSDFKWLLLLPAKLWLIGVVQPLVPGRVDA